MSSPVTWLIGFEDTPSTSRQNCFLKKSVIGELYRFSIMLGDKMVDFAVATLAGSFQL